MANTNETIADIIAEMRRIRVREFQDYADRLEAAHKREIVEVSTRAATFAINKTNEECRQKLGDAAKLREAVKAVVDVGYPHNFQVEPPHIRGYCYDITKAIEKCFDALATEKEGGDNG